MNATNIIKFATTTLAPAGIDNTYDTISPAIKLIIAITAEHIVTLKKLLYTLIDVREGNIIKLEISIAQMCIRDRVITIKSLKNEAA